MILWLEKLHCQIRNIFLEIHQIREKTELKNSTVLRLRKIRHRFRLVYEKTLRFKNCVASMCNENPSEKHNERRSTRTQPCTFRFQTKATWAAERAWRLPSRHLLPECVQLNLPDFMGNTLRNGIFREDKMPKKTANCFQDQRQKCFETKPEKEQKQRKEPRCDLFSQHFNFRPRAYFMAIVQLEWHFRLAPSFIGADKRAFSTGEALFNTAPCARNVPEQLSWAQAANT